MNPETLRQIRNRYPLLLFLFFYLLWTLFTYQDFGETWDESGVYARGIVLFHHLAGDPRTDFILHKTSPDDGMVLYDHLYCMVLYLFNPAGDVDVYHWLNMAFAALLFIAAFEVLLSLYQRPLGALWGPLFLALTPRLLGDIPANPKDMPFAVLYFLSLSAIYFLNKRLSTSSFVKGLVLGILFGLALCARMLGLTLFVVYFLFELYARFRKEENRRIHHVFLFLKNFLPSFLITFALSHFILLFSWPYLRAGFPKHLWEILSASKNFSWLNNVLFMGREVPAISLPWTYLPVWLLVTTPLFILVFLALACFMKDKSKNGPLVLFSLALGVNFILVLVLKPVLYDGLRHFLFFLPPMALLAAMSLIETLKNARALWLRPAILAFAGLNMALVLNHMVRLHPYEYVYFNECIGGLKGSEGKFDNDYWGASYKEAVEWLKRNEAKDPNRIYKVNGSGNAYQIAYYFPPNMAWSDFKDADYYLSCTRDDKHKLADASKVIHKIEREGVPLNYIFKLK